jgi:uncharacterized protein with NRDE domain
MFKFWKKLIKGDCYAAKRCDELGCGLPPEYQLKRREGKILSEIQQMKEKISSLERRNKELENQIIGFNFLKSNKTDFWQKVKEAHESMHRVLVGDLPPENKEPYQGDRENKFWPKVEEASASIRQVLNDDLPNK